MLPSATTQFRASPLTIAAAIGVSVAMMAYQVVTFAYGRPAGLSLEVLPVMLVVFLAVTWRVYRARDSEAPRRPVLQIGAGFAGFAVTMGLLVLLTPPLAFSRLVETRLPGLALALPAGVTTTGTYAQGTTRVAGDDVALLVSWQTGALPTDEDARIIVDGISSMLPDRAVIRLGRAQHRTIAHQPGRTAAIDGAMTGRLSWFGCDGRWIMVLTAAGRDGADHLHQRIIGSARCTPEPHAPPATSLGATRTAGWFAAADALPGALAMIREDGTVLLGYTQHIDQRPAKAISAGLVETLLGNAGVATTLGPAETAVGADGPRTLWTGTSEQHQVLAAVWFCDAPLRMAVAFGLSPSAETAVASREELRQQLATVHCLAPGEIAPVLPTSEGLEAAPPDEAAPE